MSKGTGGIAQLTIRLGKELHKKIKEEAHRRTQVEGIYCSLEREIVETLSGHYSAPPAGHRETKKPIAQAS